MLIYFEMLHTASHTETWINKIYGKYTYVCVFYLKEL